MCVCVYTFVCLFVCFFSLPMCYCEDAYRKTLYLLVYVCVCVCLFVCVCVCFFSLSIFNCEDAYRKLCTFTSRKKNYFFYKTKIDQEKRSHSYKRF